MAVGDKETKEVLVAANEIGVFLVRELKAKKGVVVTVEDFISQLMLNADFKAKMQVAIDNVSAVPAEVADLDMVEAFDLAKTQLSYVMAYYNALKG